MQLKKKAKYPKINVRESRIYSLIIKYKISTNLSKGAFKCCIWINIVSWRDLQNLVKLSANISMVLKQKPGQSRWSWTCCSSRMVHGSSLWWLRMPLLPLERAPRSRTRTWHPHQRTDSSHTPPGIYPPEPQAPCRCVSESETLRGRAAECRRGWEKRLEIPSSHPGGGTAEEPERNQRQKCKWALQEEERRKKHLPRLIHHHSLSLSLPPCLSFLYLSSLSLICFKHLCDVMKLRLGE